MIADSPVFFKGETRGTRSVSRDFFAGLVGGDALGELLGAERFRGEDVDGFPIGDGQASEPESLAARLRQVPGVAVAVVMSGSTSTMRRTRRSNGP